MKSLFIEGRTFDQALNILSRLEEHKICGWLSIGGIRFTNLSWWENQIIRNIARQEKHFVYIYENDQNLAVEE